MPDPRLGGKVLAAAFLFILLASCFQQPQDAGVLIQVGRTTVTVGEFESRFTLSQLGGDPDDMADMQARQRAREEFLAHAVEQALVLEHARIQGIALEPAAVDQALAGFFRGYPQEELDRFFAEGGVNRAAWRRDFEDRLLVQEVIRKEVLSKVDVSGEAVKDALRSMESYDPFAPPAEQEARWEAARRLLIRKKAQAAYTLWLAGLKKRYPVVIHRELLP
ncbi:MAG: SurA N-terminal domain-containing protein [Deltaproteobacteria bacterium]|nr:SurA N-terminal domain-containing protein [Deltaproteobacteria bacterium]